VIRLRGKAMINGWGLVDWPASALTSWQFDCVTGIWKLSGKGITESSYCP